MYSIVFLAGYLAVGFILAYPHPDTEEYVQNLPLGVTFQTELPSELPLLKTEYATYRASNVDLINDVRFQALLIFNHVLFGCLVEFAIEHADSTRYTDLQVHKY
jgi:hypothetical protein